MNNFIHIPEMTLPFESKFSARVGAVIAWPMTVKHKNKTYWQCDSYATANATGMPCACYRIGEDRLWLYCDGHIEED